MAQIFTRVCIIVRLSRLPLTILVILLDVDPYCVKIIHRPGCVFTFPTVLTIVTLFSDLVPLSCCILNLWKILQLGYSPEGDSILYYMDSMGFQGLRLKPWISGKVLFLAFKWDSTLSFSMCRSSPSWLWPVLFLSEAFIVIVFIISVTIIITVIISAVCWSWVPLSAKCLTSTLSRKPHHNVMKESLVLVLFYRWENWGARE